MNQTRAFVIAPLLLLTEGCTHLQLRKNASQQLRTTGALHEQQVMDNVAKTSANPAAWPEFARISEGLTQLTDDGQANAGFKWNARSIFEEAFGLAAKRALTESWKNVPVAEAPRLRAMWAVYLQTVYGYVPDVPGYDHRLQLAKIFGSEWEQMIPPPGWFCIQREHETECGERFYCGCVIGRHCDTRAYVREGQEASLQQLTYLIMELATVQFKEGFPTGYTGTVGQDEGAAAATSDRPLTRLPLQMLQSPTIGPAFTP